MNISELLQGYESWNIHFFSDLGALLLHRI